MHTDIFYFNSISLKNATGYPLNLFGDPRMGHDLLFEKYFSEAFWINSLNANKNLQIHPVPRPHPGDLLSRCNDQSCVTLTQGILIEGPWPLLRESCPGLRSPGPPQASCPEFLAPSKCLHDHDMKLQLQRVISLLFQWFHVLIQSWNFKMYLVQFILTKNATHRHWSPSTNSIPINYERHWDGGMAKLDFPHISFNVCSIFQD